MPTRAVDRILAEWRTLEREQARTADADAEDAIRARIEQLRHEYRDVTGEPVVDPTPMAEGNAPEQLRLPM